MIRLAYSAFGLGTESGVEITDILGRSGLKNLPLDGSVSAPVLVERMGQVARQVRDSFVLELAAVIPVPDDLQSLWGFTDICVVRWRYDDGSEPTAPLTVPYRLPFAPGKVDGGQHSHMWLLGDQRFTTTREREENGEFVPPVQALVSLFEALDGVVSE